MAGRYALNKKCKEKQGGRLCFFFMSGRDKTFLNRNVFDKKEALGTVKCITTEVHYRHKGLDGITGCILGRSRGRITKVFAIYLYRRLYRRRSGLYR